MMLFAVFLLVVAGMGYYRYRNFFAPAVISPASWGSILLMYVLLDHGMDEVSWKGIGVIALWNFCILAGIYFFSEVNLKSSGSCFRSSFNPWVRKFYFCLSVLGMIPLCFIAYKQGSTMGGDFLFNLRMANTGLVETEYQYGIFGYVASFVFISYLIELFLYHKGHSSRRLIVLAILNVILMIMTMAKSTIFFTILASFVVIRFKRKIPFRYILSSGLVLILGMSSLQLLRSAGQETDKVLSNMFSVYVFGGVPALDQIVNSEMRSQVPGQYVFALYQNGKAKLKGEKRPEKEYKNDITDDGYLYVPLPTNVYTMIGPFWLEYGWWGVGIFAFIIGGMAGIFFRLARKGLLWAIIIYAYWACVLTLQFFGEYIFTNMSYLLQLIILSIVAYKFNYIFKWRKSTSYLPHSMAKPI